jgi:hypothetical protein
MGTPPKLAPKAFDTAALGRSRIPYLAISVVSSQLLADPTTIHGARVDKGSVSGMGCGNVGGHALERVPYMGRHIPSSNLGHKYIATNNAINIRPTMFSNQLKRQRFVYARLMEMPLEHLQ